jgi:hypothetical protein
MKLISIAKVTAAGLVHVALLTTGAAQTVIGSGFSRGDFARQGWTVKGHWDIFRFRRR